MPRPNPFALPAPVRTRVTVTAGPLVLNLRSLNYLEHMVAREEADRMADEFGADQGQYIPMNDGTSVPVTRNILAFHCTLARMLLPDEGDPAWDLMETLGWAHRDPGAFDILTRAVTDLMSDVMRSDGVEGNSPAAVTQDISPSLPL